jgi:hypothetical protein
MTTKPLDTETIGCAECGGLYYHLKPCSHHIMGAAIEVQDSERMAQAGVESQPSICRKCGHPARSYGTVRYASCAIIGNRACNCYCDFSPAPAPPTAEGEGETHEFEAGSDPQFCQSEVSGYYCGQPADAPVHKVSEPEDDRVCDGCYYCGRYGCIPGKPALNCTCPVRNAPASAQTSVEPPPARLSITPLLQKIMEICDAGSAQEFGDADERLRAIRGLIVGDAV